LKNRRVQHAWDRTDLTRRLCNALDFAERAVRTLAHEGYRDSEDPAAGVEAGKVVSETGLLLLACGQVTVDCAEVRRRVENIAGLLIPHARNERVMIGSCMNPGLARDHAFAHLCLSRLGYPDGRVDELLRSCLEAENAAGPERLSHRVLEQEWLRRVWDPTHEKTCEDAGLPARSMLGRSMDVFAASRDDVYAFTHALMYLTDFGERRVDLPRSRQETLAEAETALACCLDRQDYDLCGEILLTWPYLGECWSAAAIFAFRVLTRVEDEVGVLPAPLTRLDRYRSLVGEERSRYVMATAYHTAYVMGLVCAAALRPGMAPPTTITGGRRVGGTETLLAFIDSDSNRPHWRDDLSELDPCAKNALASMLLTIGLRRSVDRRDLGRVRTLLECALRYGLVNHPAPRQAAGLLRRLATLVPSSVMNDPNNKEAQQSRRQVGEAS
jgi:hypothetical protein